MGEARIASLETEAKDLRRMLDRTAEEAFGLDDTISLEPYDEYFIRQVAKLRAAARPADSGLVERLKETRRHFFAEAELTDDPFIPRIMQQHQQNVDDAIAALSAQAPRPAAGETKS